MTTKKRIAAVMGWVGITFVIISLVGTLAFWCWAIWVLPGTMLPIMGGVGAIIVVMIGTINLHEWLSKDE